MAQNDNLYFLKATDQFLGMNFGQAPLAIAHRLVPFSVKIIKFKSSSINVKRFFRGKRSCKSALKTVDSQRKMFLIRAPTLQFSK